MHLQQRQGPIHSRCADIVEQRKDIVVIHQLQRIANCEAGFVTVVIGLDHDPAALDAARVVERKQVGHGATIEFDAERPRACREISRHAKPDCALTGVVLVGRFALRPGPIAEERGREDEGHREHRSRAATIDLRSADTCLAHLHTGRSEPDRTIERFLPNQIGRFNGARMQFVEC
jgi:hypothetical protein